MIIAYTGYPGAGKSFGMTFRAWKDLKAGRKVYSNYYIKGANKITFDDLCQYTFPKNSVIYIDEAGQWFNSRGWKDLPMDVFKLFTLHRHMKLDLVVAVQNFNRIDKALREVIELVYWADNRGYLPFIVYRGYYDVERLGMKGQSDLYHMVWKWTRARKLYDTHGERTKIDKDEIPTVPWDDDETGTGLWSLLKQKVISRIGRGGVKQ